MLPIKRLQQQVQAIAEGGSRFDGVGGGGSGLDTGLVSLGSASGSNAGAYSTANSTTYTLITGSNISVHINRTMFYVYFVFATCRITVGTGNGYIRGNLVGVNTSSSLFFSTTGYSNGFIWYYPLPGPIQPGDYTIQMEAATDSTASTITVDQYSHQLFALGF